VIIRNKLVPRQVSHLGYSQHGRMQGCSTSPAIWRVVLAMPTSKEVGTFKHRGERMEVVRTLGVYKERRFTPTYADGRKMDNPLIPYTFYGSWREVVAKIESHLASRA